ncbi:MAG: hypothetical protein AAFO07_16240 [Bacteroidota bacterium]
MKGRINQSRTIATQIKLLKNDIRDIEYQIIELCVERHNYNKKDVNALSALDLRMNITRSNKTQRIKDDIVETIDGLVERLLEKRKELEDLRRSRKFA